MNITFLRHAEVQENYIGKYNGHIDIELSKNGHLQAKKIAHELKDENYDAIYCSDLIRARQTLDAFELNVEPIFTNRLREKSWGIHEGKSFDEIEKSGIIYENFEQWINTLDGESIQSYTKNTKDFFYNTLLKSEAKNILVISHSGFIKTIIATTQNKTLEETFSISLSYAGLYRFRYNSNLT